MTADLISRSQAGDDGAFAELVDPYRRELLVHCYRMLGSRHDAEDARPGACRGRTGRRPGAPDELAVPRGDGSSPRN